MNETMKPSLWNILRDSSRKSLPHSILNISQPFVSMFALYYIRPTFNSSNAFAISP